MAFGRFLEPEEATWALLLEEEPAAAAAVAAAGAAVAVVSVPTAVPTASLPVGADMPTLSDGHPT